MRKLAFTPTIHQGGNVRDCKLLSEVCYSDTWRMRKNIQGLKASDARLPVGLGQETPEWMGKVSERSHNPITGSLPARALGFIHFNCRGTFLSFSFQGVPFCFLLSPPSLSLSLASQGGDSTFWLRGLFSQESLSNTHIHIATPTTTGLLSRYYIINQCSQP